MAGRVEGGSVYECVPEDRDGEVAGGDGRNGNIDQVVATGDMMVFVWTGSVVVDNVDGGGGGNGEDGGGEDGGGEDMHKGGGKDGEDGVDGSCQVGGLHD